MFKSPYILPYLPRTPGLTSEQAYSPTPQTWPGDWSVTLENQQYLTRPGPIVVLINYGEALSMLENYAGSDKIALNRELSEILNLMILSYFSRYTAMLQEPTDQRMYRLLEENSFRDFDNSEIALHLTLMIIKITQTYLPGFNAHDQNDCSSILDIKARDRAVIQLELEPMAYDRFIRHRRTLCE